MTDESDAYVASVSLADCLSEEELAKCRVLFREAQYQRREITEAIERLIETERTLVSLIKHGPFAEVGRMIKKITAADEHHHICPKLYEPHNGTRPKALLEGDAP